MKNVVSADEFMSHESFNKASRTIILDCHTSTRHVTSPAARGSAARTIVWILLQDVFSECG